MPLLVSILLSLIRNNDEAQWKMQTCVVATTAEINLAEDAIGVTVDGFNVSEDDLVLVKDQTDTTENGIYLVTAEGWERFKGDDAYTEFRRNAVARIQAGVGETNSDTFWTYTGDTLTSASEIGTAEIEFEAFSNGPADSVVVTENGTELQDNMRVLITGLEATWDGAASEHVTTVSTLFPAMDLGLVLLTLTKSVSSDSTSTPVF